MENHFSADTIALRLSEVWFLHKSERFSDYLAETCRKSISEQALFDCIYIAQAESGDIQKFVLRSAIRWWQVDDLGIKPISRPKLPVEPDAPENIRLGFYITPMIRFFNQGKNILIGESYGPQLFSRKVAILAMMDNQLALKDVQVVLTYDML